MFRRLILAGLTLLLLLVICLSCSDRREPYTCSTCPEIDPAYAAAFAYIEDNSEVIGLRPDIDDLVSYRSSVDRFGGTHIRFHQRYHGVRVYGGEIIIHLDTGYTVTNFNGRLIEDVTIDHRPQLSADSALSVAEHHFDSLGFQGELEEPGELVVYRFLNTDHLCWNYVLYADSGLEIIGYFVDAQTAEIVHWQSWIIIGWDCRPQADQIRWSRDHKDLDPFC